MQERSERKGKSSADPTRSVFVLGSSNFSNEALTIAFQRELGVDCSIICDLKGDALTNGHGNPSLLLINSLESDIHSFLLDLRRDSPLAREGVVVAFYNLQEKTGIERKALARGVKGFFYRHESLGHMLKGVRALLQGEIWVSREILTEIAMQPYSEKGVASSGKAILTQREIEILTLLCLGARNEEIAQQLFISTHTVKTHLYNTFKKIKAPNRLQAALWAAKNL